MVCLDSFEAPAMKLCHSKRNRSPQAEESIVCLDSFEAPEIKAREIINLQM
jgi:hypothetical protein